MTGFPSRQPASPSAGTGREPASDFSDPWGVRRAENLLTSLEGILSARVVTTPLGEVSEVHVLAQSGLQPKQLVRNIESALLAHLGVKVDHRKISIAQTAEVRPLEALERDVVRERSLQRAVLFENVSFTSGRKPNRVQLQVTLSSMGQTETAEEESADTPRARVEAAARAALVVVDRLLGDNTLHLEGARLVKEFEREFVFIAAQALRGRDSVLLTGTAEIRESPERAAVFAVMDATNRWSELRRPA
ncbi:MAG: hypothetical protein ACJ8B6_07795 [Gemmatimonadales bacterium]